MQEKFGFLCWELNKLHLKKLRSESEENAKYKTFIDSTLEAADKDDDDFLIRQRVCLSFPSVPKIGQCEREGALSASASTSESHLTRSSTTLSELITPASDESDREEAQELVLSNILLLLELENVPELELLPKSLLLFELGMPARSVHK